jgi:predicted nuclease of predicted toxin-antitoxin system
VKVKLDEHLPPSASAVLDKAGNDVHTVIAEGLGGQSYAVVFHAAQDEERLLVTLDRGFADVRSYPPGSHRGILVLRPLDQQPLAICEMRHGVVTKWSLEQFVGCNVIVSEHAIRIRRPAIDSESR